MPRSSRALLTASLALTVLFIAWAVLALGAGPLPEFDHDVALQMREASGGHDFRREAMVVITLLGGVRAMAILAVAISLWQWQCGNRRLAVACLLIVIGGGLLNLGLKVALARERPPVELRDPAVHQNNESFPSGHSMGGAIGYGLLAYVLAIHVTQPRTRIAIFLLAALWVGLIGFSRIYLRAHWFSDVVGGFTIGLAWLMFGLAWIDRWAKPTPR